MSLPHELSAREVEQASFAPLHMGFNIEASPDGVLLARLFAIYDVAQYDVRLNYI